jgi:hypothetical protein
MKHLHTFDSFLREKEELQEATKGRIEKGSTLRHKSLDGLNGTAESKPMKWDDLVNKFKGIDMPEPDNFPKSEIGKPVWVAIKQEDGTLFGAHQEEFEIVKEESAFLEEGLSVQNLGIENGVLYVDINGSKYGYGPAGGKDLDDIADSFAGLLKHSAGRALAWLKKNAELVFGSKKTMEQVQESIERTLGKDEIDLL